MFDNEEIPAEPKKPCSHFRACVDFQNKWTNFFSLNETI